MATVIVNVELQLDSEDGANSYNISSLPLISPAKPSLNRVLANARVIASSYNMYV